MNTAKFGPAGAGELFYEMGNKSSDQMPEFLRGMSLSAFEYQCGRGVNIGAEKAELLGKNAKEYNISLSIHAPYFITLATDEEEKRKNTLRYFTESAQAAKNMDASRIVFHPGGLNKKTREEAFFCAKQSLEAVFDVLDDAGFGNIIFCPETMGKINQLGDLSETLSFCKIRENMLPCIDFGHMNSRTAGQTNSYEAFAKIFYEIENKLGFDKAKITHCHFSKIEYSAGGEKCHLTFADTVFGPDYEPLMELIYKKGYTPTIICESAGTQVEDAKTMRDYYTACFDN